MSEHNIPNIPERPVIPPIYLIGIAVAGLVVALGVWLTSGTLNVVGIGALAASGLSLLMWALLAPDQVMNLLRGRFVAYGGTAVLVTVVLIVAAVLVYIVLREQGLRVDYSGSNAYTLTEATTETIQIIAADPNTPALRIIAFYTSDMPDAREQTEVLLEEFSELGGDKVSYVIYDPDREPGLADTYGATPGMIFVVPLGDDGSPIVEEAAPIAAADQSLIAEAMVTASALGDFRVYWLVVEDGVVIDNAETGGGAVLASVLRDNLNWTVEPLTVANLTNPDSGLELGTAEDGEAILIPGGANPLPDDAIAALQDYVDNGGDIVLLADVNLEGEDSLATAPNMSQFLQENYGITVNNDTVIDPQGSSSLTELNVFNFGESTITQGYTNNDIVLLDYPHSLNIAETLPDNVTVTVLANAGQESYAKTGLNFTQEITQEQIAPAEDDATGALPVGALAQNSQTGSIAVIWGSSSLATNEWRQLDAFGYRNFLTIVRSLFYTVGYEDFLANLPSLAFEAQPQDTPILANTEQLGFLRFISLILIPFGVLTAGIMVWLSNRERRVEPRPGEQT